MRQSGQLDVVTNFRNEHAAAAASIRRRGDDNGFVV